MKTRPPEPVYGRFGERVYHLRTMAGMTQEALAEGVGLTRTSIVNIEAGRQRILLHDVEAFAVALDVKPEVLMRGLWSRP